MGVVCQYLNPLFVVAVEKWEFLPAWGSFLLPHSQGQLVALNSRRDFPNAPTSGSLTSKKSLNEGKKGGYHEAF